MAQIEIPTVVKVNRRRTRTYDVPPDLDAAINAALALLVPAGTLIASLSNDDPGDGWKICNGQSLVKADFPRLYAKIGGAFGETATTFGLPDLTDKMLMGAGNIAALAFGGAAAITLSVDQLPAHGHAVTDPGHGHTFTGAPHGHTITDPGHDHPALVLDVNAAVVAAGQALPVAGDTGSATTGITVNNATAGGTNASSTTGITVASTGGGEEIDITPPVIGIYWMVRT
jgi:microcystin-dependent protein